MSKLKSLLLSSIAIFSLLLRFFVPATLADINYEITDNGEGSANEISSSESQTTEVTQSNTSNIENNVTINTNTGGNSASDNTGGETQITTGDSSVSTNISNTTNLNSATINNCCDSGDSGASISGNGSDSSNSVDINSNSSTNVTSTNNSNIQNHVNVNANTGNNTADDNNGDVSITTGNISFNGSISNIANANLLHLSRGSSGFSGEISGNGEDSDNNLDINSDNETNIETTNFSNIVNRIFFNFNTGNNSVNDNNGDVTINTGGITANLSISNVANVNDVKIDDCCAVTPSIQPTPTPDEEEEEEEEDEDDEDEDKDDDDDKPAATTDDGVGGPGGQILGLSTTSGDPSLLFNLLTIAGLASVAFGLYRLVKSHPRYLYRTPLLPSSRVQFKLSWQNQNPNLLTLTLRITYAPRVVHKLRIVKI